MEPPLVVLVVCFCLSRWWCGVCVALDPCTNSSADGRPGLQLTCRQGSLATISLQLKGYREGGGRDGGVEDALTSLVITDSNIRNLSGPIFESLLVNKLSVTYSKVSTIEADVFSPLISSLSELDLEGNALQSVPSAAIDKLANLTALNLARNKLTALASQTFAKLTSLLDVNLGGNRIKSVHASAFSGASSIERLSLQGNQISKLEKSLFRSVKKIKYLDLSFNNFTTFDRQDFVELGNLLYLNISGNQIAKLPQSVFTRNSQLLSLNISSNALPEIDAYILRGVRFLREFFARNNQITGVARRAFGSTTRLRKLDLSHNLMQAIEPEMFTNMQFLDILDLSFNKLENISRGAFSRMYKVAIDLSNNQLSRISSNAFLEVANITVLNLAHNNLSSLPRDTFEESDVCHLLLQHNFFENASLIPISNLTGIKLLNVSYNRLQEINRKAFANNKKLYEMETVDLSHNEIKDLSGSVFEKFWALRFLDLSHNKLKKIGFGAFGSLPTLLVLDLSKNEITDINSAGIANLVSLKTLFLQQNRIRKMFKIPVALNELHLEENALTRIPAGSFPMINSLLFIHLDKNNISEAQPGAFRNLLTLRHLSLRHNNLTSVSSFAPALSELASLQYLDLSGNGLETIESKAFGNLPVVFELKLDNNRIKEIMPAAFGGLLQLINLTLSHNELARISGETFNGLVSLRFLDLSHNHLTRLENKTHSILEPLLSLERLCLAHNRFSFMAAKSFPASEYIPLKLAQLDLSHNLLESLQFTTGLTMLRELNLSHNNIRQIAPHILSNITQLHSLDLSHNQLSRGGYFSSSSSAATADRRRGGSAGGTSGVLENLSIVKLGNNRIAELPDGLLSLKGLTMLDLGSNYLTTVAEEFVLLAKRQVDINITGNPLRCDCDSRRIIDRVRINQQGSGDARHEEFHDEWNLLVCSEPDPLRGRIITELDGKELKCAPQDRDAVLSGDLLFRGTQWVRRDALYVVWLVRNPKADISAFLLTLQFDDGDNIEPCSADKCVRSITLVYSARDYTFKELDSRRAYRVCVSAPANDEHDAAAATGQRHCVQARPRAL